MSLMLANLNPFCAKWPLTCVQLVQKHVAIAEVIFKIIFKFSFNVAESPPSSFILFLYENYLLQHVMTRIDFYVVTEDVSMPAGVVTTKMIVVILVTSKIVVCIS